MYEKKLQRWKKIIDDCIKDNILCTYVPYENKEYLFIDYTQKMPLKETSFQKKAKESFEKLWNAKTIQPTYWN